MKKKSVLLMVLGAVLGMMLFGCGHKDSKTAMESENKVAEEPGATQTGEEDGKAVETSESAEAEKEEDGSVESDGKGKYETYLDKKIEIDGSQESFRILRNSENAKDVKMMVGKTAVNLDRVSLGAGYSQVRVKVQDCTGDGRDDIVLILNGGASGAYNEVQILAEKEGKWKEVLFPEELWEEDCISFKKEGKGVKIAVSGTKEEKLVADSSDDEWGRRYRTCKIGKNGQIIIAYHIYRGEDINNIVGKVKLTMRYDQAVKAFKVGKTVFSF